MQTEKSDTSNIPRRLRTQYLAGLGIIAVAVLAAQVSMFVLISRHSNDAHSMNISGRQRMLSQRMTKIVLMIDRDSSEASRSRLRRKLHRLHTQWITAHRLITADSRLPKWSDDLRAKLDSLQLLVAPLSGMFSKVAGEHGKVARVDVEHLLFDEQRFLRAMEGIVVQFEQEAIDYVTYTTMISIAGMIIIVLVLILEFFFVFKPTERRLKADIVNLLAAQLALERSVHNLERLASVIPDITFVFNKEGRYLEVFTERDELLLQPTGILRGALLSDILPATEAAFFLSYIHDTLNDGKSHTFNYRLHVESGSRTFQATTCMLEPTVSDETRVAMFVRDITAEVGLEKIKKEQQQLLIRAVIDAQEAERTRISFDLHDDLGQQISFMKLELSTIRVDDAQAPALSSILSVVDTLSDKVRTISHGISPAPLQTFGLKGALENMCSQILNSTNIEISLTVVLNQYTSNQRIDLSIYRILQELLANTVKHAHATHIDIQVLAHDTSIVVTYEDDGIGFESSAAKPGLGLKGIITRVESVNGTLAIDAVAGRGTHVTAEIPTLV